MTNGKVIGRTIGDDGLIHGQYNEDSSKDTIMYDIEFDDGAIKKYLANIITMNIMDQLSDNSHEPMSVKHIIDIKRENNALKKDQQIVNTPIGEKKNLQTTTGWNFLVQFNDGSKSQIPLQSIKRSNPIQTADFVKARGAEGEPAFDWQVTNTLRYRDIIVSSINFRGDVKNAKYGIKITNAIQECTEIEQKNGNNLWHKAVEYEMKNISVAFEILDENISPLIVRTKFRGHLNGFYQESEMG